MSKIVISGYYGFGNAGDEAMLSAILEALFSVIPQAEVTVISGNPKETMKKHAVKAVPRLSPFLVTKEIKGCDLLISGGGSLLQDVTSKRSLYYYLSVIRLAKLFKKPVMLYAQGIGPINRLSARTAVGNVLNKVDLITVRDEKSKDELLSMGVQVPIQVTADAVLSMHPVDRTIGMRLLKDFHLKGTAPLIGVSLRSWKDATAYRKALAKTLDDLQTNYDATIVFIPMQYPSDAVEAKRIADLMTRKAIILEKTYTTTELLALAGCVDIMIGIRLHALVFGALMEKPIVGISYDPKIDNFLGMLELTPIGTMDELSSDDLYRTVSAYIEDKNKFATTLRTIRKLREDSLQNAHMAIELLESHHK